MLLDIRALLTLPEMKVEEASYDVEKEGMVRMVAVAKKVNKQFAQALFKEQLIP